MLIAFGRGTFLYTTQVVLYAGTLMFVFMGALFSCLQVSAVELGATHPIHSPSHLSKTTSLSLNHYENTRLDLIGEVLAIEQDPKGFVWIGGKNGLARMNGLNAKIFQHNNADATSISTNTVNDLAIDKNGDLWVATYWGLNRYDAQTERFIRFMHDPEDPRSLSHNSVIKLFESREGELWIATDGGGLLRFNHKSQDFDAFKAGENEANGITQNSISALSQESSGLLWVGVKNDGINIFDPITERVVDHIRSEPDVQGSLSNAHATDIQKAADGTMWVGTYWGLNRHLGEYKFERYYADLTLDTGLRASNVNCILTTLDGAVWVATGDQGVAHFNAASNSFDIFLHEEGMSYQVGAMFQDASQGMWLGFKPSGVARGDRYGGAFKTYTFVNGDENSLSNSDVMSIAEDDQQNLWVGTREGLNLLDRSKDKVTRFSHSPTDLESLPSHAVSSLVVDKDSLWAGTTWGGLAKLNLKTHKFQRYFPDDSDPASLTHREVWSLLRTESGVVWVGTNDGGINRYEPESDNFSQFKFGVPGKQASGRALSLYQDPEKDIWIATDDGLFYVDHQYQAEPPYTDVAPEVMFDYVGYTGSKMIHLRIPVVRDVYQDANNNLWLATESDGIHVWHRETGEMEAFRARDGLVDNTVSSIVEDDYGDLWLSTANGISRFTPSDKSFKNFTTDHGLPSNTFSHPAGIKASNGDVILGGLGGLTVIKPSEVFTNKYQAPLVMTGFYLFNQEVLSERPVITAEDLDDAEELEDFEASLKDKERVISEFSLPRSITYTDHIELRHDQSVLTFEFALLNFDVSEQNQYAYQLEGFDEDWTHSGSRRSASYTNLDPGRYVFRVKAANNEGLWMGSELQVELVISPPWWATWWAYVLYASFPLGVLYMYLYSQNSRRIFVEQQNKLLEEKIAERTQELENKNKELQTAYEKMEEASFSDQLTGLKNRRYLYSSIDLDVTKVLRSYYRAEDPVTLCDGEDNLIFYLIDVDHFKSINDKYGHNNGDIILKTLAEALTTACRKSDMVIRWGGEEFLIVCRYSSRQFAASMAEKLRATMANIKFELESGEVLQRTCSIGYACFPFDIHNPKAVSMEQTIAIADWCLYRSKHSGRNAWSGAKLMKPLSDNEQSDVLAHVDDYERQGSLQVKTFKG